MDPLEVAAAAAGRLGLGVDLLDGLALVGQLGDQRHHLGELAEQAGAEPAQVGLALGHLGQGGGHGRVQLGGEPAEGGGVLGEVAGSPSLDS